MRLPDSAAGVLLAATRLAFADQPEFIAGLRADRSNDYSDDIQLSAARVDEGHWREWCRAARLAGDALGLHLTVSVGVGHATFHALRPVDRAAPREMTDSELEAVMANLSING